jgi:hypothetical protein
MSALALSTVAAVAGCSTASVGTVTRPSSQTGTQTSAAGPASTGWGTAQPVAGFAALPGHDKDITPSFHALSCPSPGNCAGGGLYYGSGEPLTFYPIVVGQAHGTWGDVQLVPGVAGLEKGRQAAVNSVSCARPGDCTASGSYTVVPVAEVGPERTQVFVASEVSGRWRPASALPGYAALDTAGHGEVFVSCGAPGTCAAVGSYSAKVGRGEHSHAVIASQAGGTWQPARQPAGAAFLNAGGASQFEAVSCAAPGDCGAGGMYTGSHEITHAFVITQAHGIWATAQEVRGAGQSSYVTSISCVAPGDCTAAGSSRTGSGIFAVTETGGRWGSAQLLRASPALRKGAILNSVSCASPGNCAAGGSYATGKPGEGTDIPPSAALVVTESRGVWQGATVVPGIASLNAGRQASVTNVSCAPGGGCTAAGHYTDRADHTQAFIVGEKNGRWGQAELVRGITAAGGGSSEIDGVVCPAVNRCSAVGGYVIFGRTHTVRLFTLTQH